MVVSKAVMKEFVEGGSLGKMGEQGCNAEKFYLIIYYANKTKVYIYRYMRSTKSIVVLLILTVGVVLGGNCPIQLSEQPKIASDEIKIQANTQNGSTASLINYSYPYNQEFETTPSTALGINGFDLQPSSLIGIQIVINKITNSLADFTIFLNQTTAWNQMRINFLSTSRSDIEIGSASLPKDIANYDNCPLNYKFKKTWGTNSFLKFKIFLSGIRISSQQNVLKLNLERADATNTGINIIYSVGGSSTKIDLLTVDLIIFNSYNPAFRFAEGVFSQNYIQSTIQVQISPQGVSELRTYMIGITSFEVNSNTPISLYSQISNLFSLKIGPVSDNCKVNYITISYLILSVYPQCGACPQYPISYNGACVQNCPVGYYISNGKCVPKTCGSGLYLLNGICTKCPKYSDIKECNNSCPTGYQLRGQECHPICTLPNEVYSYSGCVCDAGYYKMKDGQCKQCNSGTKYDSHKQQCVSLCPDNAYFDSASQTCKCQNGFNMIYGACVQCRNDQVYNPNIQQCVARCNVNQIWQNNECICTSGYYKINGVCQICPSGTSYNPNSRNCEQICKQKYQYFINNACACIPGTVLDSTGTCNPKQCPDNSQYNNQSDTCVCNNGYYLDLTSKNCVKIPQCPPNSVFTSVSCVCNAGYNLDVINKVCVKCDINQYQKFNGQQCVCIDGYTRNKQGKCIKNEVRPTCTTNQIYNDATKSCQCKTGYQKLKGKCVQITKCKDNQYWNGQDCVCKTGYVLNKNKTSCQKVDKEIPKCSYNSHFNGVKCICNDKFFELQPGLCAICPPSMSWNGKKCAYSKDCWAGYKWDESSQCCIPKATECPPNSAWNGQACECKAGFFSYNSQCAQCQAGYQFDGSSCVRVQYDISCPGSNMIVINMQCICRPGTNNYNGSCIECPYPTVWNGWYCQGNNDGCFTVPNSHINPVDRRCECDSGYRAVEGSCISIGIYPHGNNGYGSNGEYYGHDDKKGSYGSNSYGGNNFGQDSSSGAVQQTGTNYQFTNNVQSTTPSTSTYPLPPAPTGYAYYMLDSNNNVVPYQTSSPYQYNPNMPYGQIFSPLNPVKVGGVVAVGVDPAINGGNLGLYANPNAAKGLQFSGVNTPSYNYNNQHR